MQFKNIFSYNINENILLVHSLFVCLLVSLFNLVLSLYICVFMFAWMHVYIHVAMNVEARRQIQKIQMSIFRSHLFCFVRQGLSFSWAHHVEYAGLSPSHRALSGFASLVLNNAGLWSYPIWSHGFWRLRSNLHAWTGALQGLKYLSKKSPPPPLIFWFNS